MYAKSIIFWKLSAQPEMSHIETLWIIDCVGEEELIEIPMHLGRIWPILQPPASAVPKGRPLFSGPPGLPRRCSCGASFRGPWWAETNFLRIEPATWLRVKRANHWATEPGYSNSFTSDNTQIFRENCKRTNFELVFCFSANSGQNR